MTYTRKQKADYKRRQQWRDEEEMAKHWMGSYASPEQVHRMYNPPRKPKDSGVDDMAFLYEGNQYTTEAPRKKSLLELIGLGPKPKKCPLAKEYRR